MLLSTLLISLTSLPSHADREVHGLVLDSRELKPTDAFLAIKGTQQDGRQYIADAVAKKAAAILYETEEETDIVLQENIPLIPIKQLRMHLGQLAASFYDMPAERLRLIGVTGTNGKTSCTHFITQLLEAANIHCGLIGTLGNGFFHQLENVGLTTPDAINLHKILRRFADEQAQAVAMEVSSHSIHQQRLNSLRFDIGVFTNLSQDHLDYHGTMQAYAGVKRQFLADEHTKTLIINADDDYGRQWISELRASKPVVSYSLREKKLQGQHIFADKITATAKGITCSITSPWGTGELTLPLIGTFNLSNALAVLGVLCTYGLSFDQALQGLATLQTVPGRMQQLHKPGKPLVVVDYSHTPDSLQKALEALRPHTKGRLICVFGCGGNRDQSKRPVMAGIAQKLADEVIVTNDNPRLENPDEIVQQILSGFTHRNHVTIEQDRSKAIQISIQCASKDDCILIAGKGAERYQQIGNDKFPFDDLEQAQLFL